MPTSKRGKTSPHNTKKITVVLNAANRSLLSIDAAWKHIRLNILRHSCSECYYLLICVMRSGIRIYELLNLRLQDIEYHDHVINIVKAKGSNQRRLLLDVMTLAELHDYVAKHTVANNAPLPNSPAMGLGAGEAVWSGDHKHVHSHSFRHTLPST